MNKDYIQMYYVHPVSKVIIVKTCNAYTDNVSAFFAAVACSIDLKFYTLRQPILLPRVT